MNTNNLKRFAKEARIKLLDQVGRKLEFVLTHDTAELRGKQKEIEQLRRKIAEHGKEQVIETVAYTWFNRLMALRFMDANGYTIPKVVTPLPGMTNPEILQNALGGNVEAELKLDRQRLNDLLDGKTAATDAHTEAYKMLLVASCNQWHMAMPFMFERISDYTELLLPDDLLSDYSIVADIRNGMSDEDCQQEELIGWLYQFYIADKKDDVFEGLKKNIKITAENIPAATQLFTPRWIVRYMVENTLGKLWLSLRPNSKLRDHMPYYIESPEQPTTNNQQPIPEDLLKTTNHQLATKITFLDPCQGSGHVLVYAFDLFTKIYEEEGYNTNEIPALILEHNLFGIDIDERAAQLAAFALTMKARSYYTRFLRKPVQPNIIALENVSEETIKQSVKLPFSIDGKKISDHKDLSLYLFTQADNFGSLIQISPDEVKAIQIQESSIWQEQQLKLKDQAEYLSRQYHCVVTNPPYLGQKGMNGKLKGFVETNFPKSKTDLMACFMERCINFCSSNGVLAMINQHTWMFITSYGDLRISLIDQIRVETLLHLGTRTFPEIGGEVVQNAAFTFSNYHSPGKGVYFRLVEFLNSSLKEEKFIEGLNAIDCAFRFEITQDNFKKIPTAPIGYWLSASIIDIFETSKKLEDVANCRKGLTTSNDSDFIRLWYEVSYNSISLNSKNANEFIGSGKKYAPVNKGGGYRKWYGNNLYLIDWDNNGSRLKNYSKAYIRAEEHYFKSGVTWNAVSSNRFCCRYNPPGFIFNDVGPTIFDYNAPYLLMAYLMSNVANEIFKLLCPTLKFEVGQIQMFPSPSSFDSIGEQVPERLIELSKYEWDSHEVSWDFQQNEIVIQDNKLLKEAFESFKLSWLAKFYEMHQNEESLNRQFIAKYNLKSVLLPSLPLEEITLLQEESRIINEELYIDPAPVLVQLLSYSIGCCFGRYSLNKPGLILANQGETLADYVRIVGGSSLSVDSNTEQPSTINHQPSTITQQPTTNNQQLKFMPDEDNIIPVLDGEWFNDDIVGRFKVFLKAAFGEEHFEENLKYIEDTIGKDIRKYFVKDFYNDHIKRYKKRPIYWMFSSPKGHFKALIYMHRYQPDLCSKMLNDYLQAFISKLEAAKQTQTMLSLREDLSAREKTAAIKEIDKLELMLKDCREYEKTLFTIATQKISIDLDDGVKVNYQKFKEVLVPIKGLEKEEE
jgi:hypothetical protein